MRAVGSKEMLAAAASFLLFHRAFGGLPLVKVTRKLVGKETLKIMQTPGHTSGSISLLLDKSVFVGDLVFADGGVGRTDLPTGDFKEIENSIRNKLYKLDNDILVHPGHGTVTKIGLEKKFNAFFTE